MCNVCKIKSSWSFRQLLQAGQDRTFLTGVEGNRIFLTVFHVPYLYCQLAKISFLSAQKHCSLDSVCGLKWRARILRLARYRGQSSKQSWENSISPLERLVNLTLPILFQLVRLMHSCLPVWEAINFPSTNMQIENHYSFPNQVKFKTIACMLRIDFRELFPRDHEKQTSL